MPHWAFLVCPKDEGNGTINCTMHHATNLYSLDGYKTSTGPWRYEVKRINLDDEPTLLVRVLITKISRAIIDRVYDTLIQIPLRQGDPSFNCTAWVRTGLEELRASGFEDIPPTDELFARALEIGEDNRRRMPVRREQATLDLRVTPSIVYMDDASSKS